MPEFDPTVLLGSIAWLQPTLKAGSIEAYALIVGIGIGATWMYLVARFHPGWLGLVEKEETRKELDQIRVDLVQELREVEKRMRELPSPFRRGATSAEKEEQRAA